MGHCREIPIIARESVINVHGNLSLTLCVFALSSNVRVQIRLRSRDFVRARRSQRRRVCS